MIGFQGKITLFSLALGFAVVMNAIASGDVDIDLRCDSSSTAISNALGNASYDGTEKRYLWTSYETYHYYSGGDSMTGSRISGDGYVDVLYADVKPYVLREDLFKANPNYYRTGMSGSGSEGWWVFSDSNSATFPPRQYHQYATPTPSKNSAVIGTSYGQIKLTYKRYDGSAGEKVVNVQVQKRECEAYNNGKWREVSPGRWEMQ
jgi:hypothetical protein